MYRKYNKSRSKHLASRIIGTRNLYSLLPRSYAGLYSPRYSTKIWREPTCHRRSRDRPPRTEGTSRLSGNYEQLEAERSCHRYSIGTTGETTTDIHAEVLRGYVDFHFHALLVWFLCRSGWGSSIACGYGYCAPQYTLEHVVLLPYYIMQVTISAYFQCGKQPAILTASERQILILYTSDIQRYEATTLVLQTDITPLIIYHFPCPYTNIVLIQAMSRHSVYRPPNAWSQTPAKCRSRIPFRNQSASCERHSSCSYQRWGWVVNTIYSRKVVIDRLYKKV